MRKPGTRRELFSHELRRDGKVIALLRAVEAENGAVTVETELRPSSLPSTEPHQRQYAFTTRDQAARFVEDAVDSLQYLGCTITS